jgi:hypothetical protein
MRGLLKISPRILTKIPMEFQLLHRAIKGTPVVSLSIVTRAIHIRLLARQICNARILPTTAATRPAHLRRSLPARLRRSLPAVDLLFSSATAPCVTTVTRTFTGVRKYVFPANLKTVDARICRRHPRPRR